MHVMASPSSSSCARAWGGGASHPGGWGRSVEPDQQCRREAFFKGVVRQLLIRVMCLGESESHDWICVVVVRQRRISQPYPRSRYGLLPCTTSSRSSPPCRRCIAADHASPA
jgi:hypothetical protein